MKPRATSGSYLALAHAKVAFGFLRDCVAAGHLTPAQPVHVLELEAASGRFGYGVYRNLTEILDQSSLSHIPIKLILTDSSESARASWKEHARLKTLSEAGCFDFANLDANSDGALPRLEISGRSLSSACENVGNPQPYGWRLDAAANAINAMQAATRERAGKPGVSTQTLSGEAFLNPVIVIAGSVPSLADLRRLCGERFLLLLREPGTPGVFAGYSSETAGRSFGTVDSVEAFCLLPGSELKETGLAFREAFEQFNPDDLEALFFEASEQIGVQEYLARVRLSNYDAQAACRQADRVAALIVETAGGLPGEMNLQLRAAIRKVWDTYYPIGEPEDVALALAWVVIALADRDFAFELLAASLARYGESEQRAFLVALCHFQQDDLDRASEFLEIALNSNCAQEEYRWLQAAIEEKRRQRVALEYDQRLDHLSKLDRDGAEFHQAAKVLDEFIAPNGYPAREADPGSVNRLTIGMATYDDWDGVYFSVMAIRLFHPEITDRTEILVIDNHPGGKASGPLADLTSWVKNYRYVPAARPGGTASRDLVFRYSNAEFVLCMDSHIFFAPGSLAALLDYLDANPGTRDLLQGPMLYDDVNTLSTHWDPQWNDGMFGTWGQDPRGADLSSPPFEIPLQGLGMFACRRDAWPGFNPRFRGFGGEEGYIHEKFRQAGAATLCLPFLRWLHRFSRPGGVPYHLRRRDRIRNYLIGFEELGLDPAPGIQHFEELDGVETTRETVCAIQQEICNPFYFFEAIYCINMDGQEQRWEHAMRECRKVGIAEIVERFPAVATPHNHHIGCALSHRAILAEARRRGLRNVLVLEDDVVFASDALDILRQGLAELRGIVGSDAWEMLYLGGYLRRRSSEKVPGCRRLELAYATTTHAVAYCKPVYDQILQDLPDNPAEMALWLRDGHTAIDWYYLERFGGSALMLSPVIASQLNLLPYESRPFE